MALGERQLIAIATRGIIGRGDLEGKRGGLVKYNPDGTNPAASTNKVPVQLEGEAERIYATVPTHLRSIIQNGHPVYCRRSKKKRWHIVEIDEDAIEDVTSGAIGRSPLGARTQTKTVVGSGGSGGTGIMALRYGGTGADLSATGGTGYVIKQASAGAPFTVAALVASEIPSLDTSKLTTGLLALARGGTHADLNATGGTGKVLKQLSAGADITVDTLAASEIPNLDAAIITTGQLALARGGTAADLSSAVNGYVVKAGSVLSIRAFTVSTSAPTVNEDSGDGYGVFSLYHHYDPGGGGEDDLYWCADATVGEAVWNKYALQSHSAIFSTLMRVTGTLQSLPATGNDFAAYGGSVYASTKDDTTNPEFYFMRRNTAGSDPSSGDVFGAIYGRTPTNATHVSEIRIVAAENQSGTNRGGKIEIYTVKNTTNTSTKRLTIEDTGRAVFVPDTAVAPINMTPAATPSTLADGDRWADTTYNASGTRISGMSHYSAGVIFTQTADGSAAASGSDSALEGTGIGTLTVKANRWIAGSTFDWEMWGGLNTDNSATSRTFRLGFKYGSTELVSAGITFGNNYSTANEPNGRSWYAKGTVTVRTGGASGTAIATIWLEIDGLTPRLTTSTLVSSLNFTTDTALSWVGRWTTFASGQTATARRLHCNQLM